MAQASYLNVIKTAGTSTALTNEATSKVTANKVYQITDATKRVLDRGATPVIEVDADGAGAGAWAVADPATYVIDYLFGKVTFLADQGADAVVRFASGNYLPMVERTGFNSYRLTLGGEVLDGTTFENNDGERRRQLGLHDVTAELSGFQDPWFFGWTDCGKNTAGAINATDSPVTFNMEAAHGLAVGNTIRIEDEVLIVTAVNVNAITASRAQWSTNAAAHALGKDVLLLNSDILTRNPFLVEFRPGGYITDVYRGWFKRESKEDSGDVGALEQNSVSLVLDGDAAASFGRGAA
jgi:hypothetical protein